MLHQKGIKIQMFLEPAAVPTASAELRADRTLASLALHSSAKVINIKLSDPNYSACLLLGRLWVRVKALTYIMNHYY